MANNHNGNGHPKKKRARKNVWDKWELSLMKLVMRGIDDGVPTPAMVAALTKASHALVMTHAVNRAAALAERKKN